MALLRLECYQLCLNYLVWGRTHLNFGHLGRILVVKNHIIFLYKLILYHYTNIFLRTTFFRQKAINMFFLAKNLIKKHYCRPFVDFRNLIESRTLTSAHHYHHQRWLDSVVNGPIWLQFLLLGNSSGHRASSFRCTCWSPLGYHDDGRRGPASATHVRTHTPHTYEHTHHSCRSTN